MYILFELKNVFIGVLLKFKIFLNKITVFLDEYQYKLLVTIELQYVIYYFGIIKILGHC